MFKRDVEPFIRRFIKFSMTRMLTNETKKKEKSLMKKKSRHIFLLELQIKWWKSPLVDISTRRKTTFVPCPMRRQEDFFFRKTHKNQRKKFSFFRQNNWTIAGKKQKKGKSRQNNKKENEVSFSFPSAQRRRWREQK